MAFIICLGTNGDGFFFCTVLVVKPTENGPTTSFEAEGSHQTDHQTTDLSSTSESGTCVDALAALESRVGGFRLLGEGDTGDGEGEPEGGKESWERSYRLVVLRWRLPAPSPQLSKNSFPSSLSSQSSEGERETQVRGFTFGSMVVQ